MAFLWLAGLALAVLPAQAPASAKTDDFPAEFTALEKEFQAAIEKYFEPWASAKTDEERAKVELDPEKHPLKTFTPRFDDLAKRAKGTETGARATFWVAENQLNVREPDTEAISKALATLTTEYIDSPVMKDVAGWLQYASRAIGTDKAIASLETIAEKSKPEESRAAALFSLGALLQDDGKGAEAAETFRRLKKDFGSTDAAKRAESYLFEIENLQIGMVAPDFDAVDENGTSYKLSDYRGKVVVLDFWGIW